MASVRFIWLDFQDVQGAQAHKSLWQTWPGVFDSWYMSQIGQKYSAWDIRVLRSNKRLADFATGADGWFYETHRLADIVSQVLIDEFGYSYDEFCPVVVGGGGIGGMSFFNRAGVGFPLIGEAGCFLQSPGQEIGPLWHEMAHTIAASGDVGHTMCFEYPGQPMCDFIKNAILTYQTSMLTGGTVPVPICGTIQPNNKVSVKLTWKPAPGAVSEAIKLCVYGAGCVTYNATGGAHTITDLPQGVTWGWSVVSTFSDGSTVESVQSAFTTVGTLEEPYGPHSLQTIPANPKAGDSVRFTWVKGGPSDQLVSEQFILGPVVRHNSAVSIGDNIYDIRTILPDQTPEVIHDNIDVGDLAWYIRALFSGGREIVTPLQAFSVSPQEPPVGQAIMPISLWHAINYWASYWQLQGLPQTINGWSVVDLMAAISASETYGNPWSLNPCAKNPASTASGPWQELDTWGPLPLRCAAWSSTRIAFELLGVNGYGTSHWLNRWSAWQLAYDEYMRGRIWDGYSVGIHRVSSSCQQGQPCDNPVVDLSIPGSVTWNIVSLMGSYSIRFNIFNQTTNVAVFTVMAIEAPDYDVVGGDVLWLPEWSGKVILSPAIDQIMPNSTGHMTIILRPKTTGVTPPIKIRIYGENVGVGSLNLSNSALGIYENMVPVTLTTGGETQSVTGQRLYADIAFDHQGSAAVLDASISVTGSGLLKQATLRIPVQNDSVPRRYGASAYLGTVTDADPRGEWQAKATIKHKDKELISRVLTKAYLVS